MKVFSFFQAFKNISLSGVSNFSAKVFIISDILRRDKGIKKIFWGVNNFSEQENVIHSLHMWTDIPVYSLELDLNQEGNKEKEKINQMRLLETLSLLQNSDRVIIVFSYTSLFQTVPLYDEIIQRVITLKKGDNMPIMDLFEQLIDRGYEVSEDMVLDKGKYFRQGGVLSIFPVNMESPVVIEADFDQLGKMMLIDKTTQSHLTELTHLEIYPVNGDFSRSCLMDYLPKETLVIDDEIEAIDEFSELFDTVFKQRKEQFHSLSFTSFFEEGDRHENLHYLSVLRYYSLHDLLNDFREKQQTNWKILFFTKNFNEMKAIFDEKNIPFHVMASQQEKDGIFLLEIDKEDTYPYAFQNPHEKILVMTDKEIMSFKERKRAQSSQKVYLDFLTSLRVNDYVVHSDHGIGMYQGLEKRTVDNVTREYLKIGYAENDKLFVPIDQADKVNKYIGASEGAPKLTRLGSAEWATVTNKVRKETEKIAQELLELYAGRQQAKGFAFKQDVPDQEKFEKTFPYEETPGQVKAILDVKADMEKAKPMDRLICGDVGFGKTEVAMRASFKAVQNGKQVALISPITILADQHYHSFTKRMNDFHVRVEMLSRFKSKKEQKDILCRLERGEVDIIIGTHRLLQSDIKFKDLGLVIIDEEQRFGVKQKETLKHLRKEVDIMTLTATPIPRTLNIALNKIRDITTITTPPPGRLPVITEVRRYSNELVRDVILREIARKGQVYFLHNRVQTIDGVMERLSTLIPEAKFIVAHGKLSNSELEQAIINFKDGKYDVLVSSTIIENGIDLPNANTLIVNNAERFGLAQLYQLRGRVGRSRTQAYAYFLYHQQKLPLDAKKRLRAIVEASELGSGFQIAMKDLEIRGAGDILGVNQHGAINVVGVSHFMRMLNKAVEDLKAGKRAETEEIADVSIELPLTCFIPDYYVVNTKEKINVYQRLASADNKEYLDELSGELVEDYGQMPREVRNLFRVLEVKILAKKAFLTNIKAENIHDPDQRQIVMTMSDKMKPEHIFNMLEYNSKWIISGSKLKIKSKDLGVNWFSELRENVKRLGSKPKKKHL
ncbi:transcription-repair coupling factor [Candidatus Peregrinibacteria bacterium]|nr:transcription-repair coupling factor [Candidatus Peregrinibacteria bacterium]